MGAAEDLPPVTGLYISIPFCRSKCTYCNFASGVYPASDHGRYVERLMEDLGAAEAWATSLGLDLNPKLDTIYLGGGTPSLLAPELLARLFDAIRARFRVLADAEVTMECAPGQIAGPVVEAMTACGVNRVSLGVQSFIDSEAHASGRLHSRAVVEDDLRRLRAAGIANLNLDLIAGLAGQTFASWDESLSAVIDCGVPHASVYMLEVDEDSRLGRELLGGGARYRAALVPSDEAIATMYERAIERLAGAGLRQYEISNFSRPGCASRHNLRYWQRRPYLGVGLDAASALWEKQAPRRGDGDGGNRQASGPGSEDRFLLRSTMTSDLQAYLAGPQAGETAWLSPQRQHEEAWFLGLRMNEGIEVAALLRDFGPGPVGAALETAQRLAQDGLLDMEDGRVRLTARGRLLSNDVFQEFLAAAETESAV